jgi:predicted Rossmann-fold nucleotide-binding protein
MMMIWQLIQVRKLHNTPFILVGSMWDDLGQWVQQHMIDSKMPMADPIDLTIPSFVDTCEEAVPLLKAAYEDWLKL